MKNFKTILILHPSVFNQAYHEKRNLCFSFAWLQEEHQVANHFASQVYSLSGSYVQVEPVDSTLLCGQTQMIEARYILKESAIGELKELTFYYLVRLKPRTMFGASQ